MKYVPPVTAEEGKAKALLAIYKRCKLLTIRSTVLTVIIMHGRGPSSKMPPQLQPKKAKIRLNYVAVYIVAKGIISAVYN